VGVCGFDVGALPLKIETTTGAMKPEATGRERKERSLLFVVFELSRLLSSMSRSHVTSKPRYPFLNTTIFFVSSVVQQTLSPVNFGTRYLVTVLYRLVSISSSFAAAVLKTRTSPPLH